MSQYRTQRRPENVDRAALEADVRTRYAARCRKDFEFFCAKEIKIRTKKGEISSFVWNKPQKRLAKEVLSRWYKDEPVRIIVLKARQWGCTTLVAAFVTWVITQNKGKTAMVLSDDDDSTGSIQEMYEIMRDNLSDDVRPVIDKSNRKTGYATTDRSAVRIKTAGTKQTASKTGRSKTNQLLHLSEVAFWDSPEATLRAARQTCPMGGGTFMIDESTPNGEGNMFHKNWKRAKSGKSTFLAFFVPWFEIEEYQAVTNEKEEKLWEKYKKTREESIRSELGISEFAIEHHNQYGLNLGQLKWWYWKYMDACDGDLETMNQEYPWDDVSCFLATGRPAFNPGDLTNLKKFIFAPNKCDIYKNERGTNVVRHPNGVWRMWEEPIEGGQYIVSADVCSGYVPGKGSDLDKSAVGVFKRLPEGYLELVCCFYGRPEPDEVGEFMVTVGEYYNWAYLAPEVNSYGVGTLRVIRQSMYPNLYRRQELNRATGSWQRNQIGWYTSSSTRPDMIATTKRMLRLGKLIVHDDILLGELQSLVHNEKNGKVEAQRGEHDDAAIMLMIAAQVSCEIPEIEAEESSTLKVKSESAIAIEEWDRSMRQESDGSILGDLASLGIF